MLIEIGISLLGGISGAVLFHAGLARKVYNLQCDIATLQERLLQEKNQRAALTRHKDKESLEVLRELQKPVQDITPKNHLAKFGIGR